MTKKAKPAKKKQAPKRGRGRPRVWDREIVLEELCEFIAADETNSIVKFCDKVASDGGPKVRAIYAWLESNPAFRAEVQRAHKIRAARLIDGAMAIVDDGTQDTDVRTGRDGEEHEVPNHEWMQRSKMRMEFRLRIAAQLDREGWSPRAQLQVEAGESFDVVLKRALGLVAAAEEAE